MDSERLRLLSRPLWRLALLLSMLLGLCASATFPAALDTASAIGDARAHVRALEDLLTTGGFLRPGGLVAISADLEATRQDLQRIENDLPIEPLASTLPAASGFAHLLHMGTALVAASINLVDAARLLVSHTGNGLSSLGVTNGDCATTPQPPTAPTAPTSHTAPTAIPADKLQHAAADIAAAGVLLRTAIAQRSSVRESDLHHAGLDEFLPVLRAFDTWAPRLLPAIGSPQDIATTLAQLLGTPTSSHYLLLLQDSDELRPTGGFIGNYGVITLSGGQLTGGINLHNIYSLDCPQGCIPRLIPGRFSWMTLAPITFGLRDSNLDPDYLASARLAEQLFAAEAGSPAAGVVSITPAFIEHLLRVTGPITVQCYNRRVSADDLRDTIHFYHVADYRTPFSSRKAFDRALGASLLKALVTLPAARQKALIAVVLNAFSTRDLQLFVNDEQTERMLTAFDLDGSVRAPPGDGLFVVDTNVGGNYANEDVTERVADTITLDANGTATHDLTLSYVYHDVPHPWSAVWVAAGGDWVYRDFVRVNVPATAQFLGQQGCLPYATDEPDRMVWACHTQVVRPHDLTLRFRWQVPHAVTTARGISHYDLTLQHQPGTRNDLAVTVILPAGTTLMSSLCSGFPAASDCAGAYEDTAFDRDATLSLSYTHTP